MALLLEYLLLEGGNALKTSPITQAEFTRVKDELTHHVKTVLEPKQLAFIGSAGKKPNPTDTSGDIDIAAEIDTDTVNDRLKDLAGDQPHRAMPGINVYSFGYPVRDKIVQVDLMPVPSVRYASWVMNAHPADLKRGLKSAHRNELLFAIAKHADTDVTKTDDNGDPLEITRYFLDLSQGLFRGTQSRLGKNGKIKKNFSTVSRELVTTDPRRLVKLFFGDHVRPTDVQTYHDTLAMINADKFKHAASRDKIIQQALDGITKKGLAPVQSSS